MCIIDIDIINHVSNESITISNEESKITFDKLFRD